MKVSARLMNVLTLVCSLFTPSRLVMVILNVMVLVFLISLPFGVGVDHWRSFNGFSLIIEM